MGITNNIPPSRLIQPGVCTSTTRPASPFEGQAIFETDTDRMLIWNGTVWVMPNKPSTNPDGLELVTTATCSSGGTAVDGVITVGTAVSSVTVTNAFSATYDNYFVTWTGGIFSTLALLGVYMGATTGSGYYGAKVYSSVSGTVGGAGDNNNSQWSHANAGAAGIANSAFTFLDPFAARRTSLSSQYYEANGGSSVFGTYQGLHDAATSYTSFTLDPQGTTTMTGGTIRVYGYRK